MGINKLKTGKHINKYLAYDLGASSGRAMVGYISENQKLTLEEIHRFPTGMINVNDSWHWNIFNFFQEMKTALKKTVQIHGSDLKTMAIDTWGVDFGLLSKNSEILGLPYAYRDNRTEGIPEAFFKNIEKEKVYELTGVEVMQINSLYQLYAMVKSGSPLLDAAESLLFIPDLLNFLFTGVKATEFSFATTSQMYNPKESRWEKSLFSTMGLSTQMMCDVVLPGTKIGCLPNFIQKETGANQVEVVSVVSHDTGSAVASIPAQGKNWAYISSGTWSLMGVESDFPIITEKSYDLNFTNEGGVNGKFCLQKNITGLWILEQFKKSHKELADYDYERLMGKALNALGFISVINPNDKIFINPANMGEAIKSYLTTTGQIVPESLSQIVRMILESLAFKYRQTLDQLRQISPNPIETIHIIGGGAQNYVLNQYTANVTGLTVIAGPYEGTAIGNVIVQAITDNSVHDIDQARTIIRNSTKLKTFIPQDRDQDHWENGFQRYKEKLIGEE